MGENGRDRIEAAFARLDAAARAGFPCEPVRDLIGDTDIDSAYGVQLLFRAQADAAGRVRIGRKIGLTSRAVQEQMGVDQPDFGVLFADMACEQRTPIALDRLMQPRIEAEIAFVLATDMDGELDDESVRSSVGYAVPALEIVASRIRDWDITITDTVADNASSGLYVLGERRLTLAEFTPRDVVMRMTRDGEVVSSGTGAACLDDPLRALGWLARTSARYGDPLRAGELVLSGALGPTVPVMGGDTFRAEIGELGTVEASFETGSGSADGS